jgi:predicted dehydrogenase
MIRIGVVDLDTSHPKAFCAILSQMSGVRVTALLDSHDVWPEGYDRTFAEQNNIPLVCGDLDEMVEHVDAAMIHGVNWDSHIKKILPFIKAGKHVLIDKPIVGSVADVQRMRDLNAAHPGLIFGGSSLRFANEIVVLKSSVPDIENSTSVLASGPGDFFSYAIHTTEMLQGLLGCGVTSVEFKQGHSSSFLFLTYHNGFTAILQLETPFHEWSVSLFTQSGLRSTAVDSSKLYEPFLTAFVDFVKRGNGFTIDGPLEAVLIHLAAKRSREFGGKIQLADIPSDERFSGSVFADEYAQSKRTNR